MPPILWLNGAFHETSTVPFDVADRGLLLADGVFDTSLVLDGKMVWRDAHVDRLLGSCRSIGLAIDPARIDEAIGAILPHARHASLRITVTRGAGPRGLAPAADAKPTVLASLNPLRAAALFAPLKLAVTEIRRNETSPTARIKSLAYLDGILATREALAAGCDDALFRNTKDRVACTSVGNIMALIGDQVVTPPLDDGIIAGTARGVVLATCEELGLEAVERPLTLSDVEGARAAIVTNSLRLVAPVAAIGRRQLNSSDSRRVQAIVAHVAGLIRDEVGLDPRLLAEA